jgi:hypothetical protein
VCEIIILTPGNSNDSYLIIFNEMLNTVIVVMLSHFYELPHSVQIVIIVLFTLSIFIKWI